jgi:hypothetical protein
MIPSTDFHSSRLITRLWHCGIGQQSQYAPENGLASTKALQSLISGINHASVRSDMAEYEYMESMSLDSAI